MPMAEPAGFEPANAGTKTQCLTTWRRLNLVFMIAQNLLLFNGSDLAVLEVEDALVAGAAELEREVALGKDEAAINEGIELV